MSEQLSRIQNTCPIFDNLKTEVDEVRGYLSDEDEYKDSIGACLDCIIDYADEIRNTAGDLRDTASDIASSKNDEIADLEKEVEDLNETISYLADKISALEYEAST